MVLLYKSVFLLIIVTLYLLPASCSRLGTLVHENCTTSVPPVYLVNDSVVLSRYACYPNFGALIAKPSPYLTDFFGLQALHSNLQLARIRTDMEHFGFAIVEHTTLNLTVMFDNSLLATFWIGVPIMLPIQADGMATIHHNFVEVRTPRDDDCVFLEAVSHFRALFLGLGLAKRYFPANAYLAQETHVQAILNDSNPLPPVNWTFIRSWKEIANFTGDVIVIVPEEVHFADPEAYAAVSEAIAQTSSIDWIALEMVQSDFQAVLNAFLNTTHAFPTAFRSLTASVRPYYLSLVEQLRVFERREAYALDTPLLYDFFRYGETTFGVAVRDVVWAQNVGASKRGVVMGGAAHFSAEFGPIFVNTLLQRNPAMTLLMFQYDCED